MSEYQFVALLLAAVGPLIALARRLHAPESLVLFGAGLAFAFTPGLPTGRIDPQLVLTLFLPPLLYASTVRVSWHLIRFTFLPGVVLGIGLALATIVLVATAAHFVLLRDLPWSAAFCLGAVASIFDTRLFHEAKGRPHVPRAIADTLKARELTGRLVILATFGLVLRTAQSGELSAASLFEHYVLDIAAGILVGLAVGHVIAWARRRIDPAPVEIAVSIATPYAAALLAGAFGLSVVASVTTAALVVSAIRIDRRTGAPISSSETRINATAFWEEVGLILSSCLFVLAGRALPEALSALGTRPVWQVATGTVGLLTLVLGVQYAVSYLATFLRPISGALARPGASRAAAAGAMAWSSTRSVIGIVIALSIPESLPDGRPFPERDLILVVAALMIVGSVLLQGLTLRPAVASACLLDEEEDRREAEEARRAMRDAIAAPGDEHANGFDAARQALVRLRERDRIGDETLIRMLRETDLTSRATEGDALPGAGPPQP